MFTIFRFCVLMGFFCFVLKAAETGERLVPIKEPSKQAAAKGLVRSKMADKSITLLQGDHFEKSSQLRIHPSQAESMFAQARMRLEDKNITDLSMVPTLLELSASSGYAPAQLLLLAVWEGRYIGIAAEVEKARNLALFLADAPKRDAHIYSWAEVQPMVRAFAMQRLAVYAERAWGQKEDAQAAFNWMSLAADTGSWSAKVELTRYLMNGYGCKAQPAKALQILKAVEKAAPQTPNVYFYYGFMCERGLGLIRTFPEEARMYYEQGVKRRDARACNNLAALYERGVGVKQDLARALMLYRVASEWGNKNALVNMQRVAGRMGRAAANESHDTPLSLRVTRALSRVLSLMPWQEGLFGALRSRVDDASALDESEFYR